MIMRVFFAAVALIVMMVSVGCTPVPNTPAPTSTLVVIPSPTAQPTATVQAATPVIKRWIGSGAMKTEVFTATKDPWTVTWDYRKSKTADHPTVRLFVAGETAPLQLLMDASTDGYNTRSITQIGQFYLDITGTGDWTIQALDGPPDTAM